MDGLAVFLQNCHRPRQCTLRDTECEIKIGLLNFGSSFMYSRDRFCHGDLEEIPAKYY